MRNGNSNRVLLFAAGFSVGAAVGLLFAPATGAESRRYLAKKSAEGKQVIEESGRDFVDKTRELYDMGCRLADEASELFEEGRKIVGG